jgi:hypothetical protein
MQDEWYGSWIVLCWIFFICSVVCAVCISRQWWREDIHDNGNDNEAFETFRRAMNERRAARMAEEENSTQQHEEQRLEQIRNHLYLQTLDDDDVNFANICKCAKDLYMMQEDEGRGNFLSRSWRAAESSVRIFSKQECSICLDAYKSGETIALAKNAEDCMHLFHQDCIVEWLKNHNECPLCRADLMIMPHSETRPEKEEV